MGFPLFVGPVLIGTVLIGTVLIGTVLAGTAENSRDGSPNSIVVTGAAQAGTLAPEP
jgi:hypothetical protein